MLEKVLQRLGYEDLLPFQKEAINQMQDASANYVVQAPTGAGKTLIAIYWILNNVSSGKVIYAVPSKALVAEKATELQKALGDEYSVAKETWHADIVVGTFEYFYKVLLSRPHLLSEYGFVVLDDFHTLYDAHRGSTIEKLIALCKQHGTKILALSATIEPLQLIAEWLDAKPIKIPLELRPIKLRKQVLILGGRNKKASLIDWLSKNVRTYAPILVFCATKDYTSSRAKALAEKLPPSRDLDEVKAEMEEYKGDLLDEDEEDLAFAISRGVAWHNSELHPRIRSFVEDAYSRGIVKVLFATTTLAYGVNTPTKTVVIADPYRRGELIPAYEWLQMAGRAGRLGLIDEGIVITVASDERLKQVIEEKYHSERVEYVDPPLSNEEILKLTILELVYKDYRYVEDVLDFLKNTLYYAYNFKDKGEEEGKTLLDATFEITFLPTTSSEDELYETIKPLLKDLAKHEFVRGEQELSLTSFGKAVMDFYWENNVAFPLENVVKLRNWIKNLKDDVKLEEILYNVVKHLNAVIHFKPKSDLVPSIATYFNVSEVGPAEATAYVILKEWIAGRDLDEIVHSYGHKVRYLRILANVVASGLELFEKIANMEGVTLPPNFEKFVNVVRKGLPEYLLPLSALKGFGRKMTVTLYRNLLLRRPGKEYEVVEKAFSSSTNVLEALKKIYDELGERKFKELVTSVKGIGPKRAENLLTVLSSL